MAGDGDVTHGDESSAEQLRSRGIEYPELKPDYTRLWTQMVIRREKLPDVDSVVDRIVTSETRYRSVERQSGVPWYAIATIHNLEASGSFTRHLHNGDPLTARTVHVPAGRPRSGNPPFTWEQSATDALAYHRLTDVTDWSVEHLAYVYERFNGFGYRQYHPNVKSPYLWSFSNHYTRGKYVADGTWSDTAVSQQCGAMVLLKRLEEKGHVQFDSVEDKAAGTRYPDPQPLLRQGDSGDAVGAVQAMLAGLGFDVEVDRGYGPETESAVRQFQQAHELQDHGLVDAGTWKTLDEATARADLGTTPRYWPVGRGHIITSPYGPRAGGFHTGTDFGWPGGGSGNKPVYAVQSGTVIYAGAAQGYGGPDPAGWLVIDSSQTEGGGCVEYGHVVREVKKGDHVTAGQRIAHINPNSSTNGGVAPHLHLSVMPREYNPRAKIDPVPWLGNALTPEAVPRSPRM